MLLLLLVLLLLLLLLLVDLDLSLVVQGDRDVLVQESSEQAGHRVVVVLVVVVGLAEAAQDGPEVETI